MDIDGGNLKRLMDNDCVDFGTHWNHDRKEVVYVSDSAHRSAEEMENGVPPRYDMCPMNGGNTNWVRVANYEWSDEKGISTFP